MGLPLRRIVAVDCGNTMVKMTLFEGKELKAACTFERDGFGPLRSSLEQWNVRGAIICASGAADAVLLDHVRECVDGPVRCLSHATPLPVDIDYATPDTLGLDRIAGAAGAARCFPGEAVLVADAGTALTVDVIDADGVFRGGNISAGLAMRLRALHNYTAALPEVELAGELPAFGYDTLTAMRSGAVWGLASEIAASFARASVCSGCSTLVLTGGDAPLILDILKNILASLAIGVRVEFAPLLVAHGLLSIYDYNENNS